ncbi:hypothetical protein BLOT_012210 [Blomia tropicalis]|nr:hypothetical protein BLOT_012210 [Blomia tropicalis]
MVAANCNCRERIYESRYNGNQGTSKHYHQRTSTMVNSSRAGSIQSEEQDRYIHEPRYNQSYNRTTKSPTTNKLYNSKRSSHMARQYQSEPENEDYFRRPLSPKLNDMPQDDFTRLSRLERKIDDYIKRHNELSDELMLIESDLGLILKEFNDEFQESINKTDNRHTREIGVRILDKLNHFCTIENSIELRSTNFTTINNNSKDTNVKNGKQQPQSLNEPMNKPISPIHKIQSQDIEKVNNVPMKQEPKWNNNIPKQQNQTNQYNNFPTTTKVNNTNNNNKNNNSKPIETNPLMYSHSAFRKQSDLTFNESEPNVSQFESPHLVKAQYAIINSTPYQTDTVQRLTHYKSTPSLVYQQQQQQQKVNQFTPSKELNRFSVADTYLNDQQNQSRMYINMSMVMHSDHPIIEHCFRRIEILRPRIMGYKSEHKLSVYKELDSEIINLMNRLNSVDCGDDQSFHKDKNIALCELHNLSGVLERAIECTDPECVICNSFIYSQEVSV